MLSSSLSQYPVGTNDNLPANFIKTQTLDSGFVVCAYDRQCFSYLKW